MLDRIFIDGFMRIADAEIDLSGSAVHVFCGDNEAGKSSLLKAVRFALRGVSPDVEYKKQFDELVFRGKKNGGVKLLMDGFDIARKIKDGKLTTTAPLDYHELLVDLQLGGARFGKADPIKVKQMMTKTFNIESSLKYISGRLLNKGITEKMIERVLPLINAGGFATASEEAKRNQLIQQGKWEAIAGEKYGSVKADGWSPPDADLCQEVSADQLVAKREEVQTHKQKRDFAFQSRAALLRDKEVYESANQVSESEEEIETHLQSLNDVMAETQRELDSARSDRDSELSSIDTEIGNLNASIQQAKMAAATLECPGCMIPLKLYVDGDKTSLMNAGSVRRDGASLNALIESLAETKEVRTGVVEVRKRQVDKLEKRLIEIQGEITTDKARLQTIKSAKPVTEDELAAAEELFTTADKRYEEIKLDLVKMENDKANFASLERRKKETSELHAEIAQWSLASDLLSNKPESIPSELIQRTTKPINAALMEICQSWNQLPIVVDASMTLMRGDGTPYYLLSEAAAWRADVAIQLALAKLGPLKLVAIDRFDVLQPAARGDFFDMLEWYTKQNQGITVMVCGTLKSAPDLGESIKSWWIEDGVITDAMQNPSA